jgi:hypothetical protein
VRSTGKVSTGKAARLLDVHRNTVIGWCRDAVEGRPSQLRDVEQHPITGRYRIERSEINALLGDAKL